MHCYVAILLLASSSLVRKNDSSLCNFGCVVAPGPETISCRTTSNMVDKNDWRSLAVLSLPAWALMSLTSSFRSRTRLNTVSATTSCAFLSLREQAGGQVSIAHLENTIMSSASELRATVALNSAAYLTAACLIVASLTPLPINPASPLASASVIRRLTSSIRLSMSFRYRGQRASRCFCRKGTSGVAPRVSARSRTASFSRMRVSRGTAGGGMRIRL